MEAESADLLPPRQQGAPGRRSYLPGMSELGRAEPSQPRIFVVSDGTGETASAAARAALLQFGGDSRPRTFGAVRTEAQARRVVEQAAEQSAIVVFTLVDERVARALWQRCEEAGVVAVDLLGPLIAQVAKLLSASPRSEPGLLHGFSDDYFRRVEAVEFAVRHDDGANQRTLYQADLVLTGVSRTSKTPLSMYLAQRGYKTGNVPLVPGIDPPVALFEIDPKKVFGLLVDPETLLTVRQGRVRTLGSAPYGSYADPEAVEQELARARRLCRARGWRTVNISGKAVEESAARILEIYDAGW
jgi:regulator of PEP synthase PpsR (kinase-PPPase family)